MKSSNTDHITSVPFHAPSCWGSSVWEAGPGAAMSLLAPAGSNARKYPNPEDASALRMETWKREKVSNTSGISALCFPEENSKPTPPVLPSCWKILAARGEAAGRGQQAGSLLCNNPSCFHRSRSSKICRYRCPCHTGRPAREHSDLTSITQQHGLPRNQTYTSFGSCTRAEQLSCPAPGSPASPLSRRKLPVKQVS